MQENLKYDKLKIGKYDKLKIGKYEFDSRFILGSGKYSLELIKSAIEEAKAEIITLALRRANTGEIANILDYIPKNITLLPNTSGSRNADEALRIARLSRELGCGELIKIEVISDSRYLLPDNYETIKACELLAKEGFTPLPYMHADLYAARAMRDAGAAAIMPLAAPIGSNKGLCAKEFIQILLNEIDLPIIVDAGIGSPAQACEAMQMGVSAVMINTAIAEAKDIALMARAFSLAVNAGRVAFLAGLASVSEAKASSPLTGFLRD
ncbi:thiazole synthase [Campylobacter jejuni]|nr:thiazole synthase [Campylobacter jejuni]EAI3360192.1 thiazole synthase [Campylobacter jejuni]EAI5522967.1 thiazole synthase [Campylobacter jejuni]EAI8160438.1 thiazole synthase [Campylobacter jejuni]EAK2446407.1 thiazole synthase [Campylobacter jejuni]